MQCVFQYHVTMTRKTTKKKRRSTYAKLVKKRESYLVHGLFLGMILIADTLTYVHFELLLDGYGTYRGEPKGSGLSEEMLLTEKLVLYGWYFWHLVNAAILVYLVFRIRKERSLRLKKVSK